MSKFRSRNFVFTCFNYQSPNATLMILTENCFVSYTIFQEELAPTTKRKHLQGYIELTQPMTIEGVKRIFMDGSLHLEVRRGTQEQAIAYASKEDTRIAGPWDFGKKKCQGRRSDIDEIWEDIQENFTLKEILGKHQGNALRMIHAIERGALIHHGFCSLDSWIVLNRKSSKDRLDEKVIDDIEKRLLEKN